MIKFFKILALTLAVLMSFACIGCGGGNGDNSSSSSSSGNGDAELKGTIDIYLPLDTESYQALQNVKNAYRKINPNVEINIDNTQDSVGYAKAVQGIILAPNQTAGDIVQVNVVNEYYGTDKIVDFTTYLNKKNPYAEGKVWKTLLEEDAYRQEDAHQTIPSISYQANGLVAYYNKKVFQKNGWSEPNSWSELLSVLDKAQKAGYENPLAVNYDETGIDGVTFGWLLRMYMDQYFRDMVEVAHSAETDYSFIDDLDADWVFNANEPTIDMRSQYTYNLSRVINAYFNTDDYNAKSIRYQDMMKNLYDLTRYASDDMTAISTQKKFHNCTINYFNQSQTIAESSIIYVGRMDYISTFQTEMGEVLGSADGIMPVSELNDTLGIFKMPAMTDNASIDGGAPSSDIVRTLGGPDHHPLGIINRKDQNKTNLCIDFLMFWYSQEGMNAFYEYYADNGIVSPLNCLVKNVTMPTEIALAQKITFIGDCDLNPYNIFGYGYADKIFNSSNGTVRSAVKKAMRSYLTNEKKGNGNDWLTFGTTMSQRINEGFAEYSEFRGLKFKDPSEANKYFTNSPFNIQQ